MLINYFILTLGIVLSLNLSANDIVVFEVQKTIPLTNDEIVYKDYYLSGGAGQGVRKGMIVSVLRKTPIHDNLKNKSQGFLMNPIGRLQVIHVEQEFSVGRLFSLNDRELLPVSEIEGIMIGDAVDMASALEIKAGEERPKKKSTKREDRAEEKSDQSSKAVISLQVNQPPASTPVIPAAQAAPAAIGLPKPTPVDKPSL